MSRFPLRLIWSHRLRALERRLPVPFWGSLLLGLVLVGGVCWHTARVIHDNQMYWRLQESQDSITADVDCDWLPSPWKNWLHQQNLCIFPRCHPGVVVTGDCDPSLLRWVCQLPGCTVVRLVLDQDSTSLAALGRSRDLRHLTVWGLSRESEQLPIDLSPLAECRCLQSVRVVNPSCEVAGIGALKSLPSLNSLELITKGTPSMTRELTLLTHLSHLRLVAGMMSPGDIRELAHLPADAEITLDFIPADDAHLFAVAAVPQVRQLVVIGDTVTAKGIAAISGHPWLGQCELKRHGNQLCWFPK